MDPSLLALACHLYRTAPEFATPLAGGHYNVTYRFPLPWTPAESEEGVPYGVLRIGEEDCPAMQTLGMLEWARFMSEHGAPVAAPLSSIQGNLLERLEQGGKAYTITAFVEANGVLAERIPPEAWTDDLFRAIGQAAGKMHAISKGYHPSNPALTRPQWFDSDEIHEATARLAIADAAASYRLKAQTGELRRLPVEPNGYGLIHSDLHFANFLVQPGGRVTIIDFDDCQYGWFVMDVAMALFDVLVLYHASTKAESQVFARQFMQHYLAGYRSENSLDPFWLGQIQHFLKLKELCIYAPLIAHPDISLPDSWVGRFMTGRAERIANDVPYVDIDFTLL